MLIFNEEEYRKEVFSPAEEAFRATGQLPDLFTRYALRADVTDESDITAALEIVEQFWKRNMANPKYRGLLRALVSRREAAIARRTLLDASSRERLLRTLHGSMHYTDVSSKGIGILVPGESTIRYLLHANTPLPTEIFVADLLKTETFGQRSLLIRLFEQSGNAESEVISDNAELLTGEIGELPPDLPSGSPLHMLLRLESSGGLKITVSEPSSELNLTLDVNIGGVMTLERDARQNVHCPARRGS